MSFARPRCRAIWLALAAASGPSIAAIDEAAAGPRIAGVTVDDVMALREAGRAAHALRNFEDAAALLARAAALAPAPDPELHYLLAEALWSIDRKPAARTAYARARAELGSAPTERGPRMWLARSLGRLGDRAGADAIYAAMVEAAPADAEVAIARAELHAGEREWARAEDTIVRFLSVRPTHRRALEMLAWIQEASGQLARELETRARLARDSTDAGSVRDYGRALERAGDWAAALATYERARGLAGGADDHELARAHDRLARRMSIEIAAGTAARTDRVADAYGAFAGAALPFGRAHHLALGASHERASDAGRRGSVSELLAAVSLRGAATRALGGVRVAMFETAGGVAGEATAREATFAPAAFGSARRPLGEHVELGLDAELGEVWRDAPRTVLDAGRADAVTAHVWGLGLGRRLVVDTGGQVRRLRLRPDGDGDPRAAQLFVWGGADYTLWQDFTRTAAGELLDDQLLQPTYLASSVVVSYRHYELFQTANMAFDARMPMAERASIEELSVAVRGAVLDGRLALETRAGAGYDWARALWLGRGSLALWIATTAASRLSLTVDLAKESARAIRGERASGGMAFHVDL